MHTGACAETSLVLDSLALSRALSDLAARLGEDRPGTLELQLHPAAAGQAQLELSWPGREIPRALLQEWSATPLVSDAEGRPLDIAGLLAAAGGGLRYTPGNDAADRGLVLLLPTAGGGHPNLRSTIQERPVFYAFDLLASRRKANGRRRLRELTFVVFDTETTGLNPAEGDEIIQLGAIRIVKGRMLFDETVDQLVDPQRSVPASSVAIHGIAPELLVGQPTLGESSPAFGPSSRARCWSPIMPPSTCVFSTCSGPTPASNSTTRSSTPCSSPRSFTPTSAPPLDAIAERFDIPIIGRHTALGDAIVTAEVLLKLIPLLEAQGIDTLEEALAASAKSPYARMSLDQSRPASPPESR